jgi:serine/threonine protein kinase
MVNDVNSVHAKLGDLGSVTIASPTCGETLGNWQYMAPEAFRGALKVGYSAEVDVYSFGMVLWEILTNQPPYLDFLAAGRAEEAQSRILQGMRPEMGEGIPQWISKLIEACWNTEAYSRPSFARITQILTLQLFENQLARQQETLFRSGIQLTFQSRLKSK